MSLESSGLVKKTTLSNVASNEIRNKLNGSDLGNRVGCQQNWENTDRLVNWSPTNAKIKRHICNENAKCEYFDIFAISSKICSHQTEKDWEEDEAMKKAEGDNQQENL